MSKRDFISDLKINVGAGTPIIAIETQDSMATFQRIRESFKAERPMVQWDCVKGWYPGNDAGEVSINAALMEIGRLTGGSPPAASDFANPVECVKEALQMPGARKTTKGELPGTLLFLHNAQEYLNQPDFVQAILNVRDEFKKSKRVLILFGPMFQFPPQLAQHVKVLDQPLPTQDELRQVAEGFKQIEWDEESLQRTTQALTGLTEFAAEGALATSARSLFDAKDKSVDFDNLWDAKKKLVRQTPGLEIWEGPESFGSIGGCEQIKKFLGGILTGRRKPGAIVFMDEIEKALAGSSGSDSSGVSQGMLGLILAEMQDRGYSGLMLIGVPGAAKSAITKAAGKEGNIPVVKFDVAGMKNSLVGASEAQMANGLKVVNAVSNGNALFIATSNNVASLPPELLRRFKLGLIFFDVPTDEEREAIWPIYLKKYGIAEDEERPKDHDWTGAEIENVCDVYDRLRDSGISLKECGDFIVPVAISGADKIAALRSQATGRYLSASYPGWYRPGGPKVVTEDGRAMSRVSDL